MRVWISPIEVVGIVSLEYTGITMILWSDTVVEGVKVTGLRITIAVSDTVN
jgi:hypothetical protein